MNDSMIMTFIILLVLASVAGFIVLFTGKKRKVERDDHENKRKFKEMEEEISQLRENLKKARSDKCDRVKEMFRIFEETYVRKKGELVFTLVEGRPIKVKIEEDVRWSIFLNPDEKLDIDICKKHWVTTLEGLYRKQIEVLHTRYPDGFFIIDDITHRVSNIKSVKLNVYSE